MKGVSELSDFRINIQAELDAKKFTSQLNALKKNVTKIPIELEIKNADVQKALSGLGRSSPKVKVGVDDSEVTRSQKQLQSQLAKFQFKIDTKGVSADIKSIESQINRLKTQVGDIGDETKINNITKAYEQLLSVQDLLDQKKDAGIELDSKDIDDYNQALKTTQNEIKILKSDLSDMAGTTNRIKLSSQIETWLNNNTKATEEAKRVLQSYVNEIEAAGNSLTKGRYNEISNSFSQIKSEMQAAGRTGKSSLEELKRATGQIFEFAGVYGMIQNVAFEIPRQMVQAVMQVDDAMTNLQMATGATDAQAKELMSTYAQLGDQLKATSVDVAASATEYLKQGQSIEDSNKLAQDSIVLSKIGDLTSEEATATITAAMKSYEIGVDGVMDFIDKISAIDMASATDVGGLATAFNEVAANARNAGVEAEKVLAYAATIGETTQESMASVGTSLNAIFSRMGNIKLSRLTDPESGEDLSNVETSLRNVGVELRESSGEFRDFDDVLDEVAANWDSYSETVQRSIASSFAGRLLVA